MREHARESVRESMREHTRDSVREPVREPVRESVREPVREAAQKIRGTRYARYPRRSTQHQHVLIQVTLCVPPSSRLASHTIVGEEKATRVITCIDFDPTGDFFAASQVCCVVPSPSFVEMWDGSSLTRPVSQLSERISIYSYNSFVNARESVPLAAQTLPIKSNMR